MGEKKSIREKIAPLIEEALSLNPRGCLRGVLLQARDMCGGQIRTEITTRTLEVMRPGQKLSDPMHPGLRFECGNRKGISIIYRYRHPATNKQNQLTFGKFGKRADGLMDLEQAREYYSDLRAQRLAGKVPKLREKKGERLTVSDLCDLFLDRYAKLKRKSWQQDQDRINLHIRPKLGSKMALDVTYEDVQELTFHLYNFGGRTGAGAPKQAKNVRALISRIYSVGSGIKTKGAIAKAWLPRDHPNPGQLAERLDYTPNQYFPTKDDLVAFMTKGEKYLEKTWLPLLFQAQTFSRVGEVTQMDWSEIDIEQAIWTLPAEKVKNSQEHKVFLSTQSVELLEGLSGQRKGSVFKVTKDYVVHSIAKQRSKIGINEEMSSHDLRRAGLTWVKDVGGSRDIRDKLSNHKSSTRDVDAIYARAEMEELRREFTQRWCDYLEALSNVE